MSWREIRRELALARSILSGRPSNVLVQVTNRCHMRCSFCDFWTHGIRAEEELSLEDYRRLEREMTALGRFLVSLEGGEPFLRGDLVEIVRVFGIRHVPVLYTNGWFVTPGNARELFQVGLAQVGVSIDYASAERHDAKRGVAGAAERAWRAVETLRDTAPHGGRQVHVITVLTAENAGEIEPLLERTAARGVGYVLTLLSKYGARRGHNGDEWPSPPLSERLHALWKSHRHWRFWGSYLAGLDDFLAGKPLPRCRAGLQSFNIDHEGGVSACIERIDRPAGNLRRDSLAEILAGLAADRSEVESCRECWTACRAFGQTMSGGGSLAGWRDMVFRMRSR